VKTVEELVNDLITDDQLRAGLTEAVRERRGREYLEGKGYEAPKGVPGALAAMELPELTEVRARRDAWTDAGITPEYRAQMV
jgi:hypothetical protein